MKGVIDAIENGKVFVEIGDEVQAFPQSIFPKEAEVGDVVKIIDNKATVLKDETAKARKEIEELMDSVWED